MSGSQLIQIDLRVRPARAADRDRLVELWERAVRVTHHFLGEIDIATLRPLVAAELASDEIAWWVLVSAADAVIGFLGMGSDTIEGLFIDPDCHGLGGGTFLVTHAQRLSAGPLSVEVNEQNDGAVKFYQALGFTVVSRSPVDGGGRPFPVLRMKRDRATAT